MDDELTPRIVRSAELRPSWRQVAWRSLVVTLITAVALWFLAAILDGFTIDTVAHGLLAGFVVGIANAVIWPALAFLIVPLSVLTLGLGAIILNAVFVAWVLELLPGVEVDGLWTSLLIVVGLVVLTAGVSTLLALDDDAWFDRRASRLARKRSRGADVTDVPGVVFVQFDGVAHDVLRRALRSGDVPNLHRWLRDGSHRLVGWETGWSSQTGVSQCGILHGSTGDMPAFRWLDKSTGEIVVSNHPKSAAAIERAHSDGNGLLAHHGSSYGNLFSGDADAGRADHERCRPAQGGPDRSRLLRLLLAARPGHQDDAGRHRGDHARTGGGGPAAAARRRAACRAGLDVRAVAHLHHGDHPRRVGARRDERHVRGTGSHLRRSVGLRRGRSPLRTGTCRHPCGVARPRPSARPDRADGAMDAAPVQDRRALRPRPDAGGDVPAAHRPDPRRARRRAVRRGGVRRRRRRGGAHRIDRLAPPRSSPRRIDRHGGRPMSRSCWDQEASG